ncbi:MAG: hypothetical protein K2R98_30605 [Gemmataceae bacterium]|nr:hypothetical protein [Gemmataceae bacterium]
MTRHNSQSGFLERLTGALLILVIIVLGWMILAAYNPAWGEVMATDVQVIAIVALLALTLLRVSVVALLRTHG